MREVRVLLPCGKNVNEEWYIYGFAICVLMTTHVQAKAK
jgi:hypothetical protein